MSIGSVDDRIQLHATLAHEAGYITQREFDMMTDGRVSYQDRAIAAQLMEQDLGADVGIGGLFGDLLDAGGDAVARKLHEAIDEKIQSQGMFKTTVEYLGEIWGRLSDPETPRR